MIELPLPAKPTIAEVRHRFLEDQTGSRAPATQRRYASVVIRRLARWLHKRGYIDKESTAFMIARSKDR